jgi:hypothetical protein
MLVAPLALGTVPLAASGPANAGPASDPAVAAASVAPDNDRVCKTSSVPVDPQPGITIAPGSDLGLTFDKEKSRQYLFVKLRLPKGHTPRGVQLLVHGITHDHRYWNIADPLIPTPTPTPGNITPAAPGTRRPQSTASAAAAAATH